MLEAPTKNHYNTNILLFMITIRPFKGLRPRKDIVDKVASKPYDVLNSQEAKEEAKDNEFSFLKISKPEINFDVAIDQYADEVYAKGKEIFDCFVKDGVLVRDEKPSLYIYAQTMDGRAQRPTLSSWQLH